MRQEKDQKKNKGERISNSRAMGIIILIGLLFVFQVVTFVFNKIKEVQKGEVVAGGSKVKNGENVKEHLNKLFKFNPNNISADSLVLLGFSAKQAKSILNYREKGGKFYKTEDFKKLYVVDSAKYSKLKDYIVIPKKNTQQKKDAKPKKKYYEQPKKIVTTNKSFSKNILPDSVKPNPIPNIYGKKLEKKAFSCNLNTADSSDLVKLYGIGPYFAKKILRYRESLGGSFVDVMQLLEIDGFEQDRFNNIKDKIYVNNFDVKPFSFWEVDKKFLEQHPYIGAYAARGIIVFLNMNKDLKSMQDIDLLGIMKKDKVIDGDTYNRLKSYMK